MAKVIIEIKDKDDDNTSCNVVIKTSGVNKASDTEKTTTQVVYNTVIEAIKKLK